MLFCLKFVYGFKISTGNLLSFKVITENNLHDPQFPELLSLLCELRNLNVDGVKIRHGRYGF